ncbi:hypothetical protein BKA66DRAFT_529562 [Pyrenochaeta sp. MPI-SDFR-AT-0127]|nr:hypothetical protein BKA66DRAFT_529562 [Pyrenochaeta sp. MPI-SDFR-AT-0127]
MIGSRVYVRYADIEAYCSAHPFAIDLTEDDNVEDKTAVSMSGSLQPGVVIDISAQTPILRPAKSLNILPYIILCFSHSHVRFHLMTPNKSVGPALSSFVSNTILQNGRAWKMYALNSGCLKEVRLWWREKCVDVVLTPGSKWALEWDCNIGRGEGMESRQLKAQLGLASKKRLDWKGAVVVGSIEEDVV